MHLQYQLKWKQITDSNYDNNQKAEKSIERQLSDKKSSPSVAGYLSVFANGVDNFTHGLAIAASFTAGVKVNHFVPQLKISNN